MKRMWSVLGSGLVGVVAVTPLLSCNVIHGDLELLLDKQESILSPHWSSDGKSIYYLLERSWGAEYGSLWVIDIETLETERITDEELEVTYFDLSPDGSEICFLGFIVATSDGTILDSLFADSMYYSPARFSPQDPNIIYYLGRMNDSLTLNRLNRSDESDEILLTLPLPEQISCFVISCDESHVLISNTIYSLEGGNSIILDHQLNTADWHPTDPNLLVCTLLEEGQTFPTYTDDIYFYDLSEDRWSRAKVDPYRPSINYEVSFSPDGERIAVTSFVEGSEFTSFDLWLFKPSE